jgi:mono/diheme cytochrome c family protein
MPVRLRGFAAAAFAGLLMLATALMSSAHAGAAIDAASSSVSNDSSGNPIEGRKIFLRDNCYSCHGARAEGGMCPNLRNDPPDESDVKDAVEEGRATGMPPFPDLTEQDVADLAAYFESLGTANEPTFTHWWEPGVPTR